MSYTTKKHGLECSKVYRRITIDTENERIIEDIPVDSLTDTKILHRTLPPNVNQTKRILFYYGNPMEALGVIDHNINYTGDSHKNYQGVK